MLTDTNAVESGTHYHRTDANFTKEDLYLLMCHDNLLFYCLVITRYVGSYSEKCRMDPSDGVNGNFYIRVLVFDDNLNRLAFIESDIVGYPETDYHAIRNQVSDETGILFDYIMPGSVHNHAAPTLKISS